MPDSTLIAAGPSRPVPTRARCTPLIDGDVYHQWVVNATDQMSEDGVNGTPTVFIDGKEQNPNDPAAAAQAVLAAVK